MHIHTHILQALRRLRKHRHLVVVPGLVVVLTLTLHQGMRTTASVTDATAADGTLMAGGAMALMPEGGKVVSHLDGFELQKGTIVISSQGIGRVTAGNYVIEGWNGAYQVTWENDTLTIATLTTPVVVRQDANLTVVPVASQWKAPATWPVLESDPQAWLAVRSVMPLPQHFLRSRYVLLQTLPEYTAEPVKAVHRLSLLNVFKLPGTRKKEEVETRSALLQQLLVDPAESSRISSDPRFEKALGEASHQALGALATAVPSGIGSDKILSAFMETQEGLLLASFHPDSRDRAWILRDTISEDEIGYIRILLLPQNDLSEETMLPISMERWRLALSGFLATREDGNAIVQAWMPIAIAQVSAFANGGYPLRAKAYSEEIRLILEPFAAIVGNDYELKLRDARKPIIGEGVTETREGPVSFSDEPPELMPGTAKIVQDKALKWLREAGASLTLSTDISATNARFVTVSHVVFPTAKGDKEIAFTLDVETGAISGVILDGQEMPYSMPFEAFTKWVNAGMTLGQ